MNTFKTVALAVFTTLFAASCDNNSGDAKKAADSVATSVGQSLVQTDNLAKQRDSVATLANKELAVIAEDLANDADYVFHNIRYKRDNAIEKLTKKFNTAGFTVSAEVDSHPGNDNKLGYNLKVTDAKGVSSTYKNGVKN